MWKPILLLLLLTDNALGCLKIHFDKIQMNGCKCPPILYTTKEMIQENEYGSYLADRPLKRSMLTVADNCAVTVEVDGMLDNAYFMIFRDEAPPIFNMRLYPKQPAKKFRPTGITCVNVGGVLQWQYFGGTVKNMTVTLQSNAEMCGCASEWEHKNYDGTLPAITKLYDTCDVKRIDCAGEFPYSTNFFRLRAIQYTDIAQTVWEDFTCVSGSWYSNSVRIKTDSPQVEAYPSITCYPSERVSYYDVSFITPCGCRDIPTFRDPDMIRDKYIYDDDITQNYTKIYGNVTFASTGFCAPNFRCPGGYAKMVVYSMNYKPLHYIQGTHPRMSCRKTPLATTNNSISYWFLEGVMLTEPGYACYRKTLIASTTTTTTTQKPPCLCSYLPKPTLSPYVYSNPAAQVVNDCTYIPAEFTRSADNCKINFYCKNKTDTLAVFDRVEYFGERNLTYGLDVKCAEGRWTFQDPTAPEKTENFTDPGVFCARLWKRECKCAYQTVISEKHLQIPLVKAASSKQIRVPLVKNKQCTKNFYCNATDSLLIFNETFALSVDYNSKSESDDDLYAYAAAIAMCDQDGSRWEVRIRGANYTVFYNELNVVCVDTPPPCRCKAISIDEGGIPILAPDNPFVFKNISSYTYNGYVASNEQTCSRTFSCTGGQTLVILDSTEAYVFAGQVTGMCDSRNQTWILDDGISNTVYVDRVAYAVCVSYPKK